MDRSLNASIGEQRPTCVQRRTLNQWWKYIAIAGITFISMRSDGGLAQTRHLVDPAVPISSVDTSLRGSEKYVLRVDGRPFFMINIQIRFDKLRYAWGFDAKARESVIDRAAKDGFNTVSIPIHWYEVEPEKDKFDWSILEEYLGLCQEHGLKMEMLWFGANSGGHVQWLGLGEHSVHLRTPDYVMYSSAPDSTETHSDYRIRRDMSPYSLDLSDEALRKREKYVLSRIMEHIALWDRSHGSKHTVIGVQLGNEVRGMKTQYPSSLVISYLSDLGATVKRSSYMVWTRMNCVSGDTNSRVDANSALRVHSGTNVDFVGPDLYSVGPSAMRVSLPDSINNFPMIMEAGAEVPEIAQFQLAALSGNSIVDYYDMLGPDGHALYDRVSESDFKPHAAYIEDVRLVNRLLNSDTRDLALKAQGRGLFVHNWDGTSDLATSDAMGITFVPALAKSQAISIRRSAREVVLMNTFGGTFTFPPEISVADASVGHFDEADRWVKEKEQSVVSSSFSPPTGTTVRLILETPIR